MTAYHLSEKNRDRLALPGEYLFSLVKVEQSSQSTSPIMNFPGKINQRFISRCSSNRTHLIFHLPNALCRPALHWLLRIHHCNDGIYVVVGDKLFEEVVIQKGEILQASAQDLPLPAHYIKKNLIILYTMAPIPQSRELRSFIPFPTPVLWKTGAPLVHRKLRRSVLAAIIVFLTLFSLFLLRMVSANNAVNEVVQSISTPGMEQQFGNYLDGADVISLINIVKAHVPEGAWISAFEIHKNVVDIYLQGNNRMAFLNSIEMTYGITAIVPDLAQALKAITSPDEELPIHIQLQTNSLWSTLLKPPPTLIQSSNLTEKIRAVKNLQETLTDSEIVDLSEKDGQLVVSIICSAREFMHILELLVTKHILLSQFSVRNTDPSDRMLNLDIIMPFQDMQARNIAIATERHGVSQAYYPAQKLQHLDIQQLFHISVPVHTQGTPNTKLTPAFIPDHLTPQGTIFLSNDRYFSFYDTQTGFTVCLIPGEHYGNWILSPQGSFIPDEGNL